MKTLRICSLCGRIVEVKQPSAKDFVHFKCALKRDDSPMLKLDNVTITPHLAGSTIDAFLTSPKMMAGHLTRMLRGETPLPVVNGIEPTLRQEK